MPCASYFMDASHLKMFRDTLIATNRIAEHLLLIPSNEGLYLKACNDGKTICAALHLKVDFFSNIVDSYVPDLKFPCCKIKRSDFLEVLRDAVRNASQRTLRRKELISFEMQLDNKAEKMKIVEKYTRGMTKTTYIAQKTYLDELPKVLGYDSGMSYFNVGARRLNDAVKGIDRRATEVGFHISRNQIILFSHDQRPSKGGHRSMTNLSLNDKRIVEPACFGFSVYHVASLSHLAKKLKCDVDVYYFRVKYPLFLVVEIEGLLKMDMILATIKLPPSDREEWFARCRPNLQLDLEAPLRPSQNYTVPVYQRFAICNNQDEHDEENEEDEDFEMFAEQLEEVQAQHASQGQSSIVQYEPDEPMEMENQNVVQEQSSPEESAAIPIYNVDRPSQISRRDDLETRCEPSPILCNDERMEHIDSDEPMEESAPIPSNEFDGSSQLARHEDLGHQYEPSPILRSDQQMEQNEEVQEESRPPQNDSSQHHSFHDDSHFVPRPIGLDHPEIKATVNIQNQRWWAWATEITAFRE
ncbi:hypothetical protein M3Y95_01069600 [Aphelenchoides besseyi]|nr:hypothetical protein M3Y95_01069600 [Aphelenchoides besseyi]